MKRWILCLGMGCIWIGSTYCQLLWEVKGNGLKYTSYIFATNKFVKRSFLDSVPNLYRCFESCSCVISEFRMLDHIAIARLREEAILPDSQTIEKYLSPPDYQHLAQELNFRFAFDMQSINRMKPSYITAMVRDEVINKALGYEESQSVENFFALVASSKDLPVYGLDGENELFRYQFDRKPIENQCEDLIKVINYPEKEISIERSILSYYREGRLFDIVYTLTSPDNRSSFSFSDYAVLSRRNELWAKKLSLLMNKNTCFITLDAMYIGGDKGLISILRRLGYTVRPYNRR